MNCLALFGIPPWVFITIIAHVVVLGTVAYLILLERKVASWVQDRIGPNRVGFNFGLDFMPKGSFHGLGQPLADGMKFIFKEDYRPRGVDKVLFTVAPVVMIIVVILSIAVLPLGGIRQVSKKYDVVGTPTGTSMRDVLAQLPVDPNLVTNVVPVDDYDLNGVHHTVWEVTWQYHFQIANLNIGVLFILAVLSLSVYGVVVGGWASNNKYSFLGGLRATANMISYEIPLALAVLCIVVMYGTLNLETIVDKQVGYWAHFIPAWNIFTQPLAFLIFLICIHAEANRAPFDLAEAEQELVGGYHTEYSAMRFALFFLAEYAGMITTSAVCVALFFGGWHLPWIEWLWPGLRGNVDPNNPAITTSLLACVVRAFVFFGKTLLIIFVFMWVRWSLPRFRFDQLMILAWRALIPISLGLLMTTTLVVYFWADRVRPDLAVNGWEAMVLLGANAVLLAVTMLISTLLPPPPETNRKLLVPGSRYARTPVPGGRVATTRLVTEVTSPA